MARVAVIGGGYGGVTVAIALDPRGAFIEQKDLPRYAPPLTRWEQRSSCPQFAAARSRGTPSTERPFTYLVMTPSKLTTSPATGSTPFPFPPFPRSSCRQVRLHHENSSRAP